MSNYDLPSNTPGVNTQPVQPFGAGAAGAAPKAAPYAQPLPGPLATPLTASEERSWAIIAHLSSLLSLASAGMLGPVASFVVWLIFRDRSRFVAEQSMQSTLFQVFGFIANAVVWSVTIGLMSIVVGICLLPFALLVSTATVVWPLVAAYEVSQGRNFRYPIVADLVSGAARP